MSAGREKKKFVEPFDEAVRVLYGRRTDWKKYRALIEAASAAGDARAQYAMATWHLHGHDEMGIRRRPKEALPLLVKAARHVGLAALDLAFAYEMGRLVPRDERAALGWYRRAARLGCVQARFEIGRCLHWGIGTPRNEAAARRHSAIAARLGYVE